MSTRWKLTFEALCPRNPEKETWTVGVPEWLLQKQLANGHEKALARLKLVEMVLEGGTIYIFDGWSRPGKDEGCFVYCGNPGKDFKSLRIETPAPTNMLFLVFVLAEGTIDDWTWRPLSKEQGKEYLPSDINGNLIWSLNQK